jgi:hypothetical protein
MSALEIIELQAILRAEVGRATMDFVTVMFGYLVCAHFIGASLSRTKVLVLSLVYSIFCFYPILGTTTSNIHLFTIISEHRLDLMPYQEVAKDFDGSWFVNVYFFTMISAWLISLGYMYQVRQPPREAVSD